MRLYLISWLLILDACLITQAIINPPGYLQRECGTPVESATTIHPGTASRHAKTCWQVALVNWQHQFVCSGALITSSWVLVPAHCLYRNVVEHEVFHVLTSVEANQNVTNTQRRKVVRRYVHHMHSERLLDHDIALIKLETPVELNLDTCAACLPTEKNKLGHREECLASGFVFRSRGTICGCLIPKSQCVCATAAVITRENPFLMAETTLSDRDKTSQCDPASKSTPTNSFCIFFRDEHREHVQSRSVLACKSRMDGRFEITGLLIKGVGYESNNVYLEVSKYVDWIRLRLDN